MDRPDSVPENCVAQTWWVSPPDSEGKIVIYTPSGIRYTSHSNIGAGIYGIPVHIKRL